MSAATDRLNQYNGNPYNPTTNPYGLDGVGGMEANFPRALADVGTVGAAVAASADALAAALSVVRSTWDASTTAGDPGAGKIRASSPTPTSGAYTLYISTSDAAGVNVSVLLATLGGSTSFIKSRGRLVKIGDVSKYIDLAVTSVSVASGYVTVGVSFLSGPGGFAAGDAVALGWVLTGLKGDTGATGPAGADGLMTAASNAETSAGSLTTKAVTPAGAVATFLKLDGGALTGAVRGNIQAVTWASTITLDASLGNYYSVTLAGATTFANPSNLASAIGQPITLIIKQDATGGRTASWGGSWKFPNGTAPTLSTAAGKTDRVTGHVVSATEIHVVALIGF